MKALFKKHIEHRVTQAKKLLEEEHLDCLFIESGFPEYYYLDDQPTFFKANPHFNFFCPDPGQGHLLKITKDSEKPILFYYIPDDFWHEVSSLKGEFWEDFFNIKIFNDTEKAWKEAEEPNKQCAVVSPNSEMARKHFCQPASSTLLSKLHWIRSQKSDYEIECIRLANKKAAKGHLRARDCFLDGASEWTLFMEYLLASDQREGEIPYNSIVALGKNSAILHYQFPKKDGSGSTFLIDAGARVHGYCSDITRTYVQNSVDTEYKEILARVESNQKALCAMVSPGVDYVAIHRASYQMVAQILIDFNLFSGSLEEALAAKVPFHFYPHGIGHPLGIQVHDVGAKQNDSSGTTINQPTDFPYLRTLRTIQAQDVLTIEPGFYFIPLLLEQLKKNESISKKVNWAMIEKFSQYGGIRIEDNVVALKSGSDNLTRPFLP